MLLSSVFNKHGHLQYKAPVLLSLTQKKKLDEGSNEKLRQAVIICGGQNILLALDHLLQAMLLSLLLALLV